MRCHFLHITNKSVENDKMQSSLPPRIRFTVDIVGVSDHIYNIDIERIGGMKDV
ncbi:hypothetical protein J2S00_001853 [Caldalkalibacillus uzonensis]|uniref:Uncharacterized protein n=1 Tax=Caldalkalibacillus uzonensis TaxID=353224 RepID=A0ABU0CRL8_9BACI|nr:hypothetical protein [Caldalkalibacillus uzonensis]